jgi:hypothetical protein
MTRKLRKNESELPPPEPGAMHGSPELSAWLDQLTKKGNTHWFKKEKGRE